MKIKDWEVWQSYRRDRDAPPWIKIHRRLRHDPNWVSLTDTQRGQLVAIWILAADNDGNIPDCPEMVRKLCHMSEPIDLNVLIKHGFLDAKLTPRRRQVDAKLTPERRQHDAPEEEVRSKKIEAETDSAPEKTGAFDEFWKSIPDRKPAKHFRQKSLLAYEKAVKEGADPPQINAAAKRWAREELDRPSNERQFIPMAATWLNQKRFLDYLPSPDETAKAEISDEFMKAKGYEWNGEKWERISAVE